MAAVTRIVTGIGSESLKVWDAIANRLKTKPRDGLKAEGFLLSTIALISETAAKSLKGVGTLFKDSKILANLLYPISTFIEGNNFVHALIDENTTAYAVGLAALDLLIPFCDTMKVFHDYGIVALDKALPFFTSVTFKQMFGTTGGAFLALRFTERSYQTIQKIRNPDFANDRLKNRWKLIGQVALTALGALLVTFNIMGTFYSIPILALGIISLIPNFAVQYIEDEEKRQLAAAV